MRRPSITGRTTWGCPRSGYTGTATRTTGGARRVRGGPLRPLQRDTLRQRRGVRLRGPPVPPQPRLRALRRAVEPGVHAVLPGPGGEPHAPPRPQHRHGHGAGARRGHPSGQAEPVRDGPVPADPGRGMRALRQDLRTGPGRRLRPEGGRRALPGRRLPHRRRRGPRQRGPRLRAAAGDTPGHTLRAPAGPRRAVPGPCG